MKQALILNLCIAACVIAAMLITGRAEPLFGLFLLREMPFGLLVGQAEEVEGDDPSIGFTAKV
jgi:hypothetical protein